ncbi:uncharacterized protein [Heterodontus francisci]|uniref:uncharacterized protein n=1 Tax=Heterodontus francisci TaxID=7792 RepID=UPI00355C23F4
MPRQQQLSPTAQSARRISVMSQLVFFSHLSNSVWADTAREPAANCHCPGPQDKRSHNQREQAKTGKGVPNIRLLTMAEEEASTIMREEGGRCRCPHLSSRTPGNVESSSGKEEEANATEGAPSPVSSSTSASVDTSTQSMGGFKIRIWVTSWCARHRHVPAAEGADNRRTAGDQAPAQFHTHVDPLFVAMRSLLNVQQGHVENMLEMPEVIYGFARIMEESTQAMTSAMSQAFEHMASSIKTLVSSVGCLVEHSSYMRSDLLSIAVAVGSMQQSLSKRGTRNLDCPPVSPSPQEDRQLLCAHKWRRDVCQLPQGLPLRTPPG